MRLLSHQQQLDQLPASPLKDHIQKRFDQLSEDTDVPPNLILVEEDDDITGPDYAFVGNRGLLSDWFQEHAPKEDGYVRPYEWVCHIAELRLYELLYLEAADLGYLIMVPDDIVEANSELKWIFTAPELDGLSEPQPLY